MSGVLFVWARLDDAALGWYENEYIPLMTARNAKHALHCEIAPTGLEGDEAGKLDAPWKLCTVYEMREVLSNFNGHVFNKIIYPPDELRGSLLKDSRWDVRSYTELKRWQAEDWDGSDVSTINSVAVMEWQVALERHDEVLDFYIKETAPTIASSPDVLRFRLFKIDNATVMEGMSQATLEKATLDTYLTVVELEPDDWPWDVVVVLAEKPKWREYFDGQSVVKWKCSHYVVKRSYLGESKAETGSDDDNAGDK